MKKILSFVFLFAFLASSCSEEELVKDQSTSSDSLKFTASFEGDESRTYIEKGRLLRWTAGDQISLFVANTLNQQYQFEGKTGANSGYFNEVSHRFGTGNDLDCHYAVYPYDPTIEITDDTDESIQITATLPAEQSYAENSFGLGANTMVAVTQNTDDAYLKFKNVCGYLKLQLYGDDIIVKSITLKGNNNEKIAGKATITPVYGGNPSVSMTADATGTITLDCGEKGVKVGSSVEEATTFWFVVPPTIFENGVTVNVTDMNDNVFSQSTDKQVSIVRNTVKPMASVKVVCKPKESFKEALIKLYQSTNGDNWTNNTNWCSDKPIEEWYGITCLDNGKYQLDLTYNNLTGKIEQTFPDDLIYLFCYGNQLTSLDVSGFTSLEQLYCDRNQLSSLDISGCTLLEKLYCSENQLISLEVSACSSLERLVCFQNQLTSLDISSCTLLKYLQCQYNQISSEIPEWFSQLENFEYDQRYTYSSEYTNGYKDNGYGWWYPGEPEKGEHTPD